MWAAPNFRSADKACEVNFLFVPIELYILREVVIGFCALWEELHMLVLPIALRFTITFWSEPYKWNRTFLYSMTANVSSVIVDFSSL